MYDFFVTIWTPAQVSQSAAVRILREHVVTASWRQTAYNYNPTGGNTHTHAHVWPTDRVSLYSQSSCVGRLRKRLSRIRQQIRGINFTTQLSFPPSSLPLSLSPSYALSVLFCLFSRFTSPSFSPSHSQNVFISDWLQKGQAGITAAVTTRICQTLEWHAISPHLKETLFIQGGVAMVTSGVK